MNNKSIFNCANLYNENNNHRNNSYDINVCIE